MLKKCRARRCFHFPFNALTAPASFIYTLSTARLAAAAMADAGSSLSAFSDVIINF